MYTCTMGKHDRALPELSKSLLDILIVIYLHVCRVAIIGILNNGSRLMR